jgi:hypothetical protein
MSQRRLVSRSLSMDSETEMLINPKSSSDSGNYSITVTVNGCVSPVSDNYDYVIVPAVIIDNNHFMKLSPNPVKDRLTVSFDQATANSVNITIVDIQRRIFGRCDNIGNGDKIDLSRLPRGIYILTIENDKIKKPIL